MPDRRPAHHPLGWKPWATVKAERERERVSPSRTYGRRWQKLRAAYLATHPLCECGCGYAATVVDHRLPHDGDPRLMYAWGNLQAMTKPCHDRKTAARDGGFGNPVRRADATQGGNDRGAQPSRDPVGGSKPGSMDFVDRAPTLFS